MHLCFLVNALFAVASVSKAHNGVKTAPNPQCGDTNDSGQLTGPSFEIPGANFICHHPNMIGSLPCNSRSNRECWLRSSHPDGENFTIQTDYESSWPVGIRREYWLEVDTRAIAPDGYLKTLGQVFNGSYPGPAIEACWGDELVVHVTNRIPNLGTTVHWHGVRQLYSNDQDGVNGITQCPIAANKTFTYRFNITQYGHSWYHSHYQTQYSDGAHGALTIYGPSSSNWDETGEPILMTDWVHGNSSVSFRQEVSGGVTVMDSLLVGGTGTFHCEDTDPFCCSLCTGGGCAAGGNPDYCCKPDQRCFDPDTKTRLSGGLYSLYVVPEKRYLLKLVASSAETHFIFSIDDHDLEVVSTDFVPIKPYITDSVFVGIGQRYEIVVTAKPRKESLDGNYWLRTRVADTCGIVRQNDERTGVVRYNASSTATPTTFSHHHRSACEDEPADKLEPIVPWDLEQIHGNISDFSFGTGATLYAVHGAYRWEMTETPLWLNYSDPAILNTQNQDYILNSQNAIVEYPFHDGFAYLVIDGRSFTPGKGNVTSAHPMHLHGHDFAILAQEKTKNDRTVPALRRNNPARRDSVLLPADGYVALAFKLDNPGIWLLHCHIAWHSSSGFALQILERRDEIVPSLGPFDDIKQTCQGWNNMDLSFFQEESGI